MKFTKKSDALCPNLMNFYFILCLWPNLSPETKNHLLWLRKTKQTSHPLLLSTPATPSQQNRWRWIFERSFHTFQTTTYLILTQIQRWIWEKQLINQTSKGFTMEILSWNPLQHPLLPTPATLSQQNRWCWIFERSFYTFQNKTDLILTQMQRWIWEKQLINQKSKGFTMKILSWNPLQHPLLPTPATLSQKNRWCWIFEKSFCTFQITTDLILTQIQRWIWEKQLIQQKVQRLHYDYLLHTTPFYSSFLFFP